MDSGGTGDGAGGSCREVATEITKITGITEIEELRRELRERREAEARLCSELEALRVRAAAERELANSLNSIVLRWDGQGRILFLNDYGLEFFGFTRDEIVGRSVIGTIVPETETSGRDLVRMIEDILRSPESYLSNENENVRSNGERVWIVWRNRPILDESGRLVEILTTGIDASDRKRAEEALRESERRHRDLALRDDLTGLYNTRFLYQSLQELESRWRIVGGVFSVIFIDIDRFKSVVDRHGHLNASRAIQEIAATIRGLLEPPSYAVAYAGDEFVVVLPDTDGAKALETAERIRAGIAEKRYLESRGLPTQITVSCGVATYPRDAERFEDLLARADRALFDVKLIGRNGVLASRR